MQSHLHETKILCLKKGNSMASSLVRLMSMDDDNQLPSSDWPEKKKNASFLIVPFFYDFLY